MRGDLEDFGTGWYGVQLGINDNEIDELLELLQKMKSGKIEHFHISNSYKSDSGGLGDIEIYKTDLETDENMALHFSPKK